MGKCPSCGASYFLSTPSQKCTWCGKITCKKCLPIAPDYFEVKTTMENEQGAKYGRFDFCSKSCSEGFWNSVLNYPLTDIGTEIKDFGINIRRLLNSAILAALNLEAESREYAINTVKGAIENETMDYSAFWMRLYSDGSPEPDCRAEIIRFTKLGYSALALNLEKCGRPSDAAEIYEKKLKMYDKARLLRENEKKTIVKHTEVSVNLNDLLKQVKDGGIVAIYRCPHCNGTLKVNDKTSLKSLKTCEHCGSEIETVDLADFLRTALA
jgi:hypothetical protein